MQCVINNIIIKSVPREITLDNRHEHILQNPIAELHQLRSNSAICSLSNINISNDKFDLTNCYGNQLDIEVEFTINNNHDIPSLFGITILSSEYEQTSIEFMPLGKYIFVMLLGC